MRSLPLARQLSWKSAVQTLDDPMTRYLALALQTRCFAVNGMSIDSARERMRANLVRVSAQIAASKRFIGPDLKLVVLPEYFLTSFPQGESIEHWQALACLSMDDALYGQLGACASGEQVYIAGNAYERDPHFPALYFQTSFVISPSGEICLRYRRLVSMFAPTPHDVLDAYLDRYGWEGVFPVADTAIGKLAAIASEEILYPEIARAHALRGAEIFVHSTSEVGSPALTPKHIAKRARALENLAYVVSANSAGIEGTSIPAESTDGMSTVIDYKGMALSEASTGESMVAYATIELEALRAWRRRPGMGNLLARQRLELFAPTYAAVVHPKNTLSQTPPTRAHFLDTQKRVIDDLASRGLI